MTLTGNEQFVSWTTRNKLRKPNNCPLVSNSKKVWMIVRKGHRRVLVEKDLNSDSLPSVQKAISRIPRCSTKPPHGPNRSEIPSNALRNTTTGYAANRNRVSRIPTKPGVRLSTKEESKSLRSSCARKEETTRWTPSEGQHGERFLKMDKRISQLHQRMDRWSHNIRHSQNQLSVRLKKLHQEINVATATDIRAAVLRMVLHLTGQNLVACAVYASFASISKLEASIPPSTSCIHLWLDNLRNPREISNNSCESIARHTSFSIAAAFLLGLVWVKKQMRSSNKQQMGAGANAYSACRTKQLKDRSSHPARIQSGANSCVSKSICYSGLRRSGDIEEVQSDRMNNRVNEQSPKSLKGSKRHLDFGRIPGLMKSNYSFRAPVVSQTKDQDLQLNSRSATVHKDVRTSPKYKELMQFETQKDREVNELDSPEVLLEAIKPEVMHCPLSHLEACSDRSLLSPDSGWNGTPDNFKTTWGIVSKSSSGGDLQQWASAASISEGRHEESLGEIRFRSQNSMENPFYDSDIHDGWDRNRSTCEIALPYSSPNLLYGFEDMEDEEVMDAWEPVSQCAIDEIKTKWISLNDFV